MESRLLSATLLFAACSYAASPSLCSAFSLFRCCCEGGSAEESDLYPLVEALVRVDPLAGAAVHDASLREGEYASSPVEKAPEGSGPVPFGCQEPFFLVDSAKLFSVSCAEK